MVYTSSEDRHQSVMSSDTLQSSKLPSGRYLRMMRGIFRCDSSLIAICSASVSPSKGTSTGAFMLCKKESPASNLASREVAMVFLPDLQGARPQYPCTLVFGEIRCCHSNFVRLSVLTCRCCTCWGSIPVRHLVVLLPVYLLTRFSQYGLDVFAHRDFTILILVCEEIVGLVLSATGQL
jgi:hypothetical protein